MENTARAHLLFRGASEVTKSLRNFAAICDFGAAGIGLFGILSKPSDPDVLLPLAILVLAVLGSFLRAYSSTANGFAQRCRRISLRAFCSGTDVDRRTASFLDDDAPPFVDAAASVLPAKTLETYYEPTMPAGPLRQMELYAHSAFFTWRILRIQAVVLLIVGLLVSVVCAYFVYRLAARPDTATDRHAILESICTIILLAFSVRSFEACWDAYSSFTEIRSIENALLEQPTGDLLRDLTDSYDIERAAGANPMTFIYWFRGGPLSTEWAKRRTSFVNAA